MILHVINMTASGQCNVRSITQGPMSVGCGISLSLETSGNYGVEGSCTTAVSSLVLRCLIAVVTGP